MLLKIVMFCQTVLAQLFSLAGLSLEIPITTVFSLVKDSPNAENCLASLIQPDVSARGKKMTTFLPICSVNGN